MLQKTSHFMRQANLIGGEWVQADSGATIDVTNPATGLKIGTVPKSGKAETRRAIEAAETAFQSWKKTSVLERHKLLRKLHDAIMDNQQPLAELLTTEQGKSLFEAKGEIAISAAYILWFAEEGRRTYGDVVPSPWADRRIITTKAPVGVIAAITPWNFPSSMLARKLGPALAAGCTAVVKPASQTPYSALAWGVLAEEAGIPKGVVNIVTGSPGEIGDEICANPLVRKLTFTGSTEIGKILIQKCASTVKKVSMELGGNAPFIVFDDADVDRAVEGAMIAKYRNSGQTCVCTNRFLVQAGIYEEFVQKLAAASAKLKVGSGLEEGTAAGAADRRQGRRQGRGIRRGRQGQGRADRRRRQAPRARRLLLRADRDRRRQARNALHEGRDFRAGRPGVQVRDRGRGDPPRQRHRIRPCLLFLHRQSRPRVPGHGRPEIRHGRRQRRADHHGRGAVRRRQGIRPRQGRRASGHRGLSRHQICLHRRASASDFLLQAGRKPGLRFSFQGRRFMTDGEVFGKTGDGETGPAVFASQAVG